MIGLLVVKQFRSLAFIDMDDDRELQEARKLPIGERTEHKNWKCRAEAFDDIRARLEQCFLTDDPVFYEVGESIRTWRFES